MYEKDQVSIAVSCSRHVRLIDFARRKWDSGNFETFLSPCSVQGCRRLIGWCAGGWRLGVVAIRGFVFGFCACLEDSCFVCLKRLLQGLGRPPEWGSFAAHEASP